MAWQNVVILVSLALTWVAVWKWNSRLRDLEGRVETDADNVREVERDIERRFNRLRDSIP